MVRVLKNAASVLLVTATVAAAVIAGVRLAGPSSTASYAITSTPAAGLKIASAATGRATLTCPRSGCTSTYCHGANGQPPPTGPSAGGGTGAASQPVPAAGAGGGNRVASGSPLLVCPRSGCVSANCHGANGQPPPGGTGRFGTGRDD
jgi:hypothetical protein